jgi:V8-like Glu-specific endopeptidase
MVLSRFATVALLATAIAAPAIPEQSSSHFVNIDSDLVSNTSPSPVMIGIPQVVWSKVVTVPGSSWLRLEYEGVMLSGSPDSGSNGSFLRITSILDGAVQTQHLRHIGEWSDTSAYFNGDSVLVELLAQPNTGDNRLVIRNAIAGPVAPTSTDSICGPTDDRVLSSDQRVARNQPTGCTSWLINDCNHCFLTAGHCASGVNVVQFNCPLSTSGGSIQHPGPQDQYAVDASSMQSNGGQGVGNDWAYFGVFANSSTGLTPHQANGMQAFDLVSPPAVSGQLIRITGNGSVGSPVSPTWNLVQKTHAGPYFSFSGSTVRYTTDTSGGNSGSPVILDGTNQAIAIHTHGGCSSTGGSNASTGSNHGALQTALASPQGVCDCPELEIDFPNGLPQFVDPNGTTVIRITTSGPISVVAGSMRFHYSTGGAYQQVTPVTISANTFDATVPSSTCGSSMMFYISAQGTNLVTYTSPDNAPTSVYSRPSAAALTVVRNFNFNTAPAGWSVANTSLATGAWSRGTPVDPRGPSADFDGSGQCWVTGNTSNEDVDGGPTVLTTDTVDLSNSTDATVSYAVWFESSGNDTMVITASNDGGNNWLPVETITATSNWEPRSIRINTLFATPDQFVLRYSVADQPNNSVTEAALDAFRIDDVDCQVASWNTYGTGCSNGTSAPDMQLLSLPSLGSNFIVRTNGLNGGPAAMIVGLAAANATLTHPLFTSGCTLLARPDIVQTMTVFSTLALYTLPIPNNPALAGTQLHVQALDLSGQWTLSQGGLGVIN